MTPPPLRPESIQRRLAEIARLLDVLDRHRSVTGAELQDDLERRLVVERALSQVVDLAVKVNTHVVTSGGGPPPADYHTSFHEAAAVGLLPPDLANRLAPSSGLGNRSIHEYEAIDLDIVADAIGEAVDGYRAYVSTVAGWLRDRGQR